MKFLSFEWRGFDRLGWLQDDGKTVLAVVREDKRMPQTLMDVIKRGPYARHQIVKAGDKGDLESFDIDDIKHKPPFIPWATFNLTANSSDPAEAARLNAAEHPTISLRTPRNHVAQGEDIDIPLRSQTLECEAKLLIVLGRGGRYITVEHAPAHIFGYSIYTEGSVKEYQAHSSQFGLGKMFDMSAAFGPVVVTEDEFGDPYQQTIETRVDGELVRTSAVSDIRHRIEEVIAYISSAVTMFPGDIICMGIPDKDCLKPERLMNVDEKVDVTVSNIGTLSNVVKAEPTHPKVVGCC